MKFMPSIHVIKVDCHVHSSDNNTSIHLQYLTPSNQGTSTVSASTGSFGFVKSKRGSSYASEEATRKLFLGFISRLASQLSLHMKKEGESVSASSVKMSPDSVRPRLLVDVYLSGYGPGRLAVLKILNEIGISVHMISDITPLPHNGCRPKKPRRV